MSMAAWIAFICTNYYQIIYIYVYNNKYHKESKFTFFFMHTYAHTLNSQFEHNTFIFLKHDFIQIEILFEQIKISGFTRMLITYLILALLTIGTYVTTERTEKVGRFAPNRSFYQCRGEVCEGASWRKGR